MRRRTSLSRTRRTAARQSAAPIARPTGFLNQYRPLRPQLCRSVQTLRNRARSGGFGSSPVCRGSHRGPAARRPRSAARPPLQTTLRRAALVSVIAGSCAGQRGVVSASSGHTPWPSASPIASTPATPVRRRSLPQTAPSVPRSCRCALVRAPVLQAGSGRAAVASRRRRQPGRGQTLIDASVQPTKLSSAARQAERM
jgi:hypothetical protein